MTLPVTKDSFLSIEAKNKKMDLLKFFENFNTEEKCKEYFLSVKMNQGVFCKKCSCEKHYWLAKKEQFECSKCKFRTTIKSGTVMHNSRLSYRKWFMVFFLMTYTKKGISACEIQRQLGHKRYQTIWSIMHRIRAKMGKRDDKYMLKDMLEFDEAYFEKAVPKSVKGTLKRGKGSQRQVNVAVMAESSILENEDGTKSTSCRYFKMKVIPNSKKETIEEIVKDNIEKDAVVLTDKSKSYDTIADITEAHIPHKSNKNTTNTVLKWSHIAISNAKRTLLGIYHRIDAKYYQNYLDEFIYKLNRRYMDCLFERLILAMTYQPVN